jgi:succinate-semialdehyde dehydrogenase/glutarate-semialdehyde dehydrogenase
MAWLRPLDPDDLGRRRFSVRNPVDGRDTGTLVCANADDVSAAMAVARKVQPSWGKTPVKERVKLMNKALRLIVDNCDAYIETLVSDTGRTEIESLFIELMAAADAMHFYGKRAGKVLADHKTGLHLLRTKKATVTYKPLGVVVVISPWNGPFILSTNPTIQALLAGNAVLIKPSEVTPWSGGLCEEIFRDAGFPEGVVQVVQGDGATGAALIDAMPDKVCFTGSVATGRKIGAACGERLIPCTLELGGKDAMIVCHDADLDRAAGGALFGSVMNNGQYCSGTERIYVVESVAEAFIDKVVTMTASLERGQDYGPFIFEPQCDIVKGHLEGAIAQGAVVRTGGDLADGYLTPTVLTHVTHDMAVMCEETFGPILAIQVVTDEDEALRLANDCDYGLGANVWTKDNARAERIARRLDVGSVSINDAALAYGALEVPFGGRKHSGVGQVNGAMGLRNYCFAQPILFERIGLTREWVWYPYTPDKLIGLKKALRWMFSTPLRWLL